MNNRNQLCDVRSDSRGSFFSDKNDEKEPKKPKIHKSILNLNIKNNNFKDFPAEPMKINIRVIHK